MDEVIELSDSSDDTEVFHHDLSNRDEWVAEGYSRGNSEASEDEEGEVAEDQLINDSQGEEDVPDGAESSDDQESGATGGPRLAGMWSPKPGQTRRPARLSTTYTVEDDLSNASDSDERDEPRDYSWGRRSQGPRYHAPQEDDEQPWTRGGHPRYAESPPRRKITSDIYIAPRSCETHPLTYLHKPYCKRKTN